MPAAITSEFPAALQKSGSAKMNAYESRLARCVAAKNGASRKLCQKISPSGAKIAVAVTTTTIHRGRLKRRELMFPDSGSGPGPASRASIGSCGVEPPQMQTAGFEDPAVSSNHALTCAQAQLATAS